MSSLLGLGAGLGFGPSPSSGIWLPNEQLPDLDYYCDADLSTIVYGTSPYVQDFESTVGAEKLRQTSATNQPRLQSRGYGDALYFDNDHMDSSRAVTAWNYLHNGSGMTWFMLVSSAVWESGAIVTGLLSNLPLGDGHPGIEITTSSAAVRLRLSDGNGAFFVLDQTTPAVLTNSKLASILVRHQSPGNMEMWVNGTKRIDAAPSAVTASNAAFGMNFCALNSVNELKQGDLPLTFGMTSKISDSDLGKLNGFISDKYGSYM